MYACMYAYVCVCIISVCTYISVCMCVCMHVSYVRVNVCKCVYMYVFSCVCAYVYTYVCPSIRHSIHLSICAVKPGSPSVTNRDHPLSQTTITLCHKPGSLSVTNHDHPLPQTPFPAGSRTPFSQLSSPQPSHCTHQAVLS
jgi:hypothetical protein